MKHMQGFMLFSKGKPLSAKLTDQPPCRQLNIGLCTHRTENHCHLNITAKTPKKKKMNCYCNHSPKKTVWNCDMNTTQLTS